MYEVALTTKVPTCPVSSNDVINNLIPLGSLNDQNVSKDTVERPLLILVLHVVFTFHEFEPEVHGVCNDMYPTNDLSRYHLDTPEQKLHKVSSKVDCKELMQSLFQNLNGSY